MNGKKEGWYGRQNNYDMFKLDDDGEGYLSSARSSWPSAGAEGSPSPANIGNAYSEDVADVAIGLLIDVLRKVVSAADRYVNLGGKWIGIMGLGRIGSECAKRLEAFGCIVSYNSRNKKPSILYPFYSTVRELAANSDAIILCCGINDSTRYMVNKEVLVKCLVRGEIRDAGLDVLENAPDVPQELCSD
ncbi:Erythronate-4-phosphate dehydrogenase [Parasponia andersonii]|uniref:Erythronate-4-phosphate dehydrogenase n=1 Tax=Parasponia andersonii TaxID=3476 RepID=A0A2P5ALE0_PARAD|nr:Erythronate-4-phosphate dehydrogenase [Parasponia andersonii]